MQKTTQAPMRCGSRRIPEWRKAAPMISCSQTAATVSMARVVRRGRSSGRPPRLGVCTQLWLVKKAMLTMMQKNVCASVAWAVEIAGGR